MAIVTNLPRPGELVDCLTDDFEGEFTKGKTYEVACVEGHYVIVKVDDSGSTTNGLHYSHFRRVPASPTTSSRAFSTGATRDTDEGKLDYEGFLSPLVMERFAQHMHAARKMPDGTMRNSDNWQLGIPLDVYMKSMWRHFFDVWKSHRGIATTTDIETELCALRFNVDGMLHEILKAKNAG